MSASFQKHLIFLTNFWSWEIYPLKYCSSGKWVTGLGSHSRWWGCSLDLLSAVQRSPILPVQSTLPKSQGPWFWGHLCDGPSEHGTWGFYSSSSTTSRELRLPFFGAFRDIPAIPAVLPGKSCWPLLGDGVHSSPTHIDLPGHVQAGQRPWELCLAMLFPSQLIL